MDNREVYSSTTEAHPGHSGGQRRIFGLNCSVARPSRIRGPLKLAELGLSLVAFVCEEVVPCCTRCSGLYFFEFVSCSAFLLSLLLVVVFCTCLFDKMDKDKVAKADLFITLITGLALLIASIVFYHTTDWTKSETAAIVFGILASIIFLFDFVVLMVEKYKSKTRKSENAKASEVTKPLNA